MIPNWVLFALKKLRPGYLFGFIRVRIVSDKVPQTLQTQMPAEGPRLRFTISSVRATTTSATSTASNDRSPRSPKGTSLLSSTCCFAPQSIDLHNAIHVSCFRFIDPIVSHKPGAISNYLPIMLDWAIVESDLVLGYWIYCFSLFLYLNFYVWLHLIFVFNCPPRW